MTEPVDRRAAYVAGLRALADLIEANPILPLPLDSLGHGFYLRSEGAPAALAALESAGLADRKVEIDETKPDYGFKLSGRLHGVKIYASAHHRDVCIATGTTTVLTWAYEPAKSPAQAAAPVSSPEAADVPPTAAPGEPQAVNR